MPNFRMKRRLIIRRRVVVSGDAAATTAFLARTSGLDATHIAAYTALINGLVADGVFAKLDGLWVTATQDSATARFNLVSSSFSIVDVGGASTFTADRGFATVIGAQLSTQFTPSTAGGLYTLNSAHAMIWSNTVGAGSTNGDLGTFAGGGFVVILPVATATNWQMSINDGSAAAIENTATGKGFYLGSRINSSGFDYYWNLQGSTSVSGNKAIASTSLPSTPVYVGAINGNGPSVKQFSAASLGGSLTATDAGNLYSRLQTYMTAVGN